jgi:hypothetical protein
VAEQAIRDLYMLIKISNPIFKCEEDRSVFFSCLYSLYEYQDIIANGQSLELTVNEQKRDKLIDELT